MNWRKFLTIFRREEDEQTRAHFWIAQAKHFAAEAERNRLEAQRMRGLVASRQIELARALCKIDVLEGRR